MTPSICCPSCTRILGQVHPDGIFRITCASCQQNFGVVYGKLSGWLSQWDTLLYISPRLPSFYKRRYELRITTPGRDLKVIKLSMSGRSDRVPIRPGDRISIFYSFQGNRMKKLIAIYNHTIGKTYSFPSPIPSTEHLLFTQGSFATVIFLVALLNGVAGGWLPLVGALSLLAYSRMADTAELHTPPLQSEVNAEARLLAERHLLDQKVHLEQRVEVIRHERYAHQDLIQRLQTLRGKIMSFNPSLYATRVASLETAIRLLKQRLQQDQLLTDQYAQTIKMIEIELETAYLADQLPELDDFTDTILGRLEELRAIEARNQDLWLQLAANEEIRKLSFSS